MKAVVFTLGCKVNECESDSLISGLSERGYEVSDKLVPADVYIVNTCAVTSEAEKKSRQMVSRIKRLNKNAKIIFTGCASQKDPEAFLKKSNTYLITGTFSKNKILDKLDQAGLSIEEENKEFEELLPVKSLRKRTFVKVQDGCDNFCSYCIIPYIRGRNRSRNPQSVLSEIKKVSPIEAVITGINLSAYNYNGTTLSGLMETLKEVKCRIRLGSLEVNVIDEKLLTSLKNLYDFAPHFHLSLQSGSDSVLKKMNRRYTTEEYLRKVNLIREYFPDAGITTDIIVGFPTETEEDFIKTMEFVDRVKFSDIHPFVFSPRKGTVAYKMQDLDGDIKKNRLNKLIEKKLTLRTDFINSQIGKELDFLFEEYKDGFYQGYSENYVRLYLKEYTDNGKIQKVKLKNLFSDGAECTLK